MMRLILLAAASVVLVGLTASTVDADNGPILPGYWESTSKVTFPIPSSKTERKCVSGEQINSYLTGPSNPHYTCKYDTRHLEGGHATLEGECIDSSGLHSHIKVDGDYGAESFNLDGHLKLMLGGLAIPINASIAAHRLSSECPAGTADNDKKKKKQAEEAGG
jgi:hypothetical protein